MVFGSFTRPQAIAWLAERMAGIERSHTVRVAIDGVDGAGKTSLAQELVTPLRTLGRQVIRASLDGFHNPRAIRYRRGHESPLGYYLDSFDYTAVLTCLLDPLGPGGHGKYRTAIFDHLNDSPLNGVTFRAPTGAILLFDGIFLLRPELRPYWDLSVFVDVSFEMAMNRAINRDRVRIDKAQLIHRYQYRYVPGQKRYLRLCQPHKRADVIFNNEDLARPVIEER